ncbi:kxDL motif-containing protein 1 [Abrus precatorius]|uniref:KxDL motif-containing protein 1 n=1 Tax=Abrus precatorius TaxID=3816 RepID=A0A8B8KUQ1_ABRPR|nr:kxDL motif-containing protein 1 [Abrus precatorius]
MSESESESRKLGSEEISREFKTLVSSDDLNSLNHMQNTILGRLQDSNAVLSHFNDFSQHCYAEISGDIARNTCVVKSVKSDLDYIFQKLRSMKSKIMSTYPDAFPEDSAREVIDRRPDLELPK